MSAKSEALRWTVGLLEELDVPFQVVGGLAARAYGATRPLVDLDFYVPTSRLTDIAEAAAEHVVRPPEHHHDAEWDITFMALERGGVRIEFGGADDARYYDRSAGQWTSVVIDYEASVPREVLGVTIAVMPRAALVAYKQALDRPVDRQDLAEIALFN